MNDIWEWNKEVSEWDEYRLKDYFGWVKKSYGKEEVIKGFIHVDGYRAVMDVKQSVKPSYDTNPYTDALAHSMLHTKEVMAANLLKKVFEEEYEKRGKELLNEHNNAGL